jgi:hypothetical protein
MKSINKRESKKIAVMAAVIVGFMMFAFMPAASAEVTYFDVDPDTGYAGTTDSYNMLIDTTGVKTLNITIPAGFLAVEPATSGDEMLTVDFWNTTIAKGFYGIGIMTANGTGKVDVYVRFRIGGEELTGTTTQNMDYTPGVTNIFESPLKVNHGDTSTVKVKLPTEIDDGYMNITITCLDFYLESMGVNLKQCVRNPTLAKEYTFTATDGVNAIDAIVQIKETSGYGGGVYRNGQWILRTENSPLAMVYRFSWGNPTDVPFPGDWNGNGEDGIGVYRNGQWILRNDKSAGTADYRFNYGNPTDVPVPGDWDGVGGDGIGVYRNGQWILRNDKSPGTADYRFNYGNPTDVPVTGVWNDGGGDGIGVYRNGQWILRNDKSPGTADYRFNWGLPTDVPITGDWNGDGKDGIGLYRNGQWILRNEKSAGAADYRFNYGNPTDVPVPGTWA